jgi:type I restriction enzyme S subunit
MICVSEQELAIILDILKRYAPDCEARAFGSRYKWTSNDYSDLDLALTGKAKLGLSRLGRIRDAFEESDLPFRVDVLDWRCLTKEFQSIINSGYEVIYTPEKEQWQKVRLGDVCDYHIARTPTSNLTVNNYISTENILPNKFGITVSSGLPSVKFVSEYPKDATLVSNIRPYFKKIWYATEDGGCSNDVLVFRAKSNCYPKFLYYLLSEDRFFDYATLTAKGTKMPRGDKTAIMRYPVLRVPQENQRAIAATLSCLDAKIALNKRINANLEAQVQAVFKSWFVDFEPFKDGKFIDSELGRIPEGWRVGRLKDLCFYSDTKIAVSNLTTLTYISTENMLPNKAGYTQSSSLPSIAQTQEILQGDVLVSNIRPYFKKIVFGNFTGGCSADVLCFRPIDQYYSAFIYYTLYDDKFFDYMVAGSKGTKMPRGDKRHIMNYPIIIPTSDDFIRFSDLIAPLSSLKGSMLIESRTLAAIRDALLPKLMSGEIEVEAE